MTDGAKWNQRYASGDLPWDTGRPSTELQRVVAQQPIAPCRALDLGCGTGSNTIWLAQQGFDAVGVDIAPLAVAQACQRARAAGVSAQFQVADILHPPKFDQPFLFFFDRGCYHAVRREDPTAYASAIIQLLAPGARGLILAGNARESHDDGPPAVTEEQLRSELGAVFHLLELREFRFDAPPGSSESFLAWSCLVVC
jgi:SAM-dependent methyltransferase